LDTATFRGRWIGVGRILQKRALDPDHPPHDEPFDPNALVDRALSFWDNPPLADSTRGVLVQFATSALAAAKADWERKANPPQIENALRQLIAMTPDLQTS